MPTSAKASRNRGHIPQRRPVELDVLAGGEMAIALVPAISDHGELAHLPAVQRAIGDRDPEHVGVKLQIEPVLEAKRLELVLGQRPRKAAFHLASKTRDAVAYEDVIKFVVAVHVKDLLFFDCSFPIPCLTTPSVPTIIGCHIGFHWGEGVGWNRPKRLRIKRVPGMTVDPDVGLAEPGGRGRAGSRGQARGTFRGNGSASAGRHGRARRPRDRGQ